MKKSHLHHPDLKKSSKLSDGFSHPEASCDDFQGINQAGAWGQGFDASENMGLKSGIQPLKLKSSSNMGNDCFDGLKVPRADDEDELNKSKVSFKKRPSLNNSMISARPADPIEKRKRRTLLAVLAVVKFWRILERIKQYGTSSNLYNIAFRSRKSVKKSIFPIAKSSSNVKVKTKLCLLFHPNSAFLTFWNFMLLLFVFYVITLMPYLTVFLQDENKVQDGFEIFMDVSFMVDLVFNFFTAIYSPKGEYIAVI